ncbi:MAG: formyltransferase family protein [Campylobacterota bacterium]|nr:formyltransferase family protein [Campylobacterota bacterium]
MIYFVTSSISYLVLKKQYLSLNLKEAYIFLIYDTYDIKDKESFISVKDSKLFLDTVELDNYLYYSLQETDYIINFDGFHIFSKKVLNKAQFRSANFHPSPLPAYCGVNPVNWGIYNRELEWGSTWHRLTDKLDRGEIIHQDIFSIDKNITQVKLLNFSIFLGLKSLASVINILKNSQGFKTSDKIFEYSIYCGSEQPKLHINSIEDVKRLENVFPITPYHKWRWKLSLKDQYITAVSTSQTKGSLKFKKYLILDGEKIYFAD